MRVAELLGKKTVLITGTTGFVGKSYLEKLLRSCPDVTARVIARGNKKFPCARERFEAEVLSGSVFNRLRDEGVDLASRIEVVEAQLAEEQFGLSDSEFAKLAQGVDLIVNCAASVNFREPVDQAIAINLVSVQSIIRLSSTYGIPLVHVSTCYVNSMKTGSVAEKLYQPEIGIKPDASGDYPVEALIEQMIADADKVKATTPAAELEEALIDLGGRYAQENFAPDVYSLTKHLGEMLIHKHLKAQSVFIVRPAIVESAISEPVPNWMDGIKVASSILFSWARRKAYFMPGEDSPIDIIPIDMVSNAMMLASADVLSRDAGIKTCHVASSDANPIMLYEFTSILKQYCLSNWQSMENLFLGRKPSRVFILLKQENFNRLLNVVAFGVRLFGSKKAYEAITTMAKLAKTFGFYSTSRYTFQIQNLDALAEQFAQDRQEFPCDPRTIQWKPYLEGHAHGLDKYAVKPRKKKPVAAETVALESEVKEQVA